MLLLRQFCRMLFIPRNPVIVAQKLVARGSKAQSALGAALAQIWSEGLWRERRAASGLAFVTFAEFATAPPPNGLGIGTQDAVDRLGEVLFKYGLYEPWKHVLEATTRSQGRPKTNLAPSEIKIPVFQLPTSHTARAKRLMLLSKHHPAIFSDLAAGKVSWKEAIDMAGLSKSSPRRCLRMGVLDLSRARALAERGQTKLLGELFAAMSIDAQCHLLANVVGPATNNPNLAAKWRAQAPTAAQKGAGFE